MKHKLFCTLGFVVLALAGFAANPAGAATTAAGPYYATPSWDQSLSTSTRFVVLSNMNNAAVLDRETGLVWEQSPSTSEITWANAEFHCNNLSIGGRLGWRLPTVQELASLVDPSVAFPGPTLPSGHPFSNVLSRFYWSATKVAGASNEWGVLFNGVVPTVTAAEGSGGTTWCVRGGRGVDAQ